MPGERCCGTGGVSKGFSSHWDFGLSRGSSGHMFIPGAAAQSPVSSHRASLLPSANPLLCPQKIRAVYDSNPAKFKTLQNILEVEKELHGSAWPKTGATLALMWLKR